MRPGPGRIFLACTATLLISTAAAAQSAAVTGPRIIDGNRLDLNPPIAAPAPLPARPANQARPAADTNQPMTLRDVIIDGRTSLDAARLRSAWQDLQGHTVKVADVYAIADRIAALLKQAGLALYVVNVLDPGVSDGIAKFRIIEGYVANVSIVGDTEGADLSLIKAHAERLAADRPLHQATLEREVLLINDIPGVKAASQFEPVPNSAGGVRLVLDIKRKSVAPGFGIINQGNPVLSELQGNVNLTLNSLLHEGDQTYGVFGFPFTWKRYQYYGFSHQEPIGTNGTTLTITLGDLVTHPVGATNSGNAAILGISLNHPLIRGVDQNLSLIASFDALNSNNAVLGSTVTDERTRALRLGMVWTGKDGWRGDDESNLVVSEGLNAFGARRGTIAAGGPAFTKVTVRLGRGQNLPWMFIARVKVAGQVAGSALPVSEQFTYGGTDIGQAFNADAMTGDQGVTAVAELAWHPTFKDIPDLIAGSELFAGVDWGKVWNRDTLVLPASNVGASAATGVRLRLANKVVLTVAVAKPLIVPKLVGGGNGWRFVFGISGTF